MQSLSHNYDVTAGDGEDLRPVEDPGGGVQGAPPPPLNLIQTPKECRKRRPMGWLQTVSQRPFVVSMEGAPPPPPNKILDPPLTCWRWRPYGWYYWVLQYYCWSCWWMTQNIHGNDRIGNKYFTKLLVDHVNKSWRFAIWAEVACHCVRPSLTWDVFSSFLIDFQSTMSMTMT